MSTKSSNGSRDCIVPSKFAHVVLRTKRLKPMVEWHKTLNAEIVSDNDFIVFLGFDDEHHRLAIISDPELVERPAHCVGLDHLAYTYANLGELIATYGRLKAAGINPAVTLNHGLTTSVYYDDPDGGRVELQIDNFDTMEEARGFLRGDTFAKNPIGIDLDIEAVARQYRAGVSEKELKEYNPEGPQEYFRQFRSSSLNPPTLSNASRLTAR